MPVTTKPLVVTLLLSVLISLTACEKGGDGSTVDAERQRLQQELQQARDETEQALRQNSLIKSRIQTLEAQVAANAAATAETPPLDAAAAQEMAPPVAEAVPEVVVATEPVEVADVDTVISAAPDAVPEAASDTEVEALRVQVTSLISERDQLHELLEQNETALRDGVADSAQRQQQMEKLQAELTVAHAALTVAKSGQGDKIAALEDQARQAQAESQTQLEAANQKLAALEAAADNGRKEADVWVAQRASLQEQLLAVQADKAALEIQLTEQEAAMAVLQGDNRKASNQVATLKQTLAEARTHGNSLAEQLAAIQADTQSLEAKLLQQAGQLQEAHERSQAMAVVQQEVKPGDQGAKSDIEQELATCQTEEARLRDRAKALEEELAQTLERELKEQQQLQGAVAQTKALQQEVLGLRGQREERDKEIEAMETDWEHCRNRAAENLGKQIVGDGSGVIIKTHPVAATPKETLDLEQAQVLQILLEESQTLLEACNASLGEGARDLFTMEQEILGLKNAMQRQRRVAASRVRLLTVRLNQAMADVRLHHGRGLDPRPPVAGPGPRPGSRPIGSPAPGQVPPPPR
jgi:chromosome segregation ATPase